MQNAPPLGAGAQSSSRSDAVITDRYLTAVSTELTAKVDSRNAVVGQEVNARTKQAARLADGTALPKGTKLVGHVTQVRAASEQQPYSMLAMTFDRAELMAGQSVALRSVIRMIAPAAAISGGDSTFAAPGPLGSAPMRSSAPMGGVTPTGRASPIGSSSPIGGIGSSGGVAGSPGARDDVGLGAGLPDRPVRPTGQIGQIGQIGKMGDPGIGGATADAGSIQAQATRNSGSRVSTAGEIISPAPRATALPGVMLYNSGAVNASGTLTASGKNIVLESGTLITLGVITR